MTKPLLSLIGLALVAAVFASPARAAPKERCYIHGCTRAQCMGNCQLGDSDCFKVCRALFPTTQRRASTTRRTGSVRHGSNTNPTGPTLPSTHKH
jgi:hypothetical protein